jgi:hypothetical protein
MRRKVSFEDRPSDLPPELFERYVNDAFRMNPDLKTHDVPVIRYLALKGAHHNRFRADDDRFCGPDEA